MARECIFRALGGTRFKNLTLPLSKFQINLNFKNDWIQCNFEMGSSIFLAYAVLKISAFKVWKRGDFLRFSPYEIPESGDKKSNLWVFKIAF